MNRADTGAGQHGDGGFRHHWHIDSDDIALFNAEVEQDVSKAADVVMELAISDVFALAGVVAFPDNRGLVAAFGQVAIEAVSGKIQRAVFIPFNRDVARSE